MLYILIIFSRLSLAYLALSYLLTLFPLYLASNLADCALKDHCQNQYEPES